MNRAARRGVRLLAAGVLLACSPDAPAPPDPTPPASTGPPPNVVLVVLDTLRADHLSCYGYARKTSPNLDALCEQSTVYQKAYSASSWTLPSHASLFTGLLPIRHGAHHENRVLADDHQTLAEVMGDAGYQTIAIISNAMLATDRNLDQGFGNYHETWRRLFDKHPKLFPDFDVERPPAWDDIDDPLFRAAMRQLRPGVDENSYFRFRKTITKRKSDKPLFLFVNLVGVHSPYNSSGPFYERFLRNPSLELDDNRWPEYYAGRADFPDRQIDHFVDLYDAEILHVDHIVGRMIDDLKAAGMWDDTIFIVTSDHGESLGEHGHLSHVFSLHEPLTKIPLIVHYPPAFQPGARLKSPVQLIDLFPTILDAAGIDPEPFGVDGRVLARTDAGTQRDIIVEYYYPWENVRFLRQLFADDVPGLEAFERRLRAITRGDMKLVWGSDGRHELYDLSRDPDETSNLIDDPAHAATRDALLARLEHFVEEHGGATPIPRWDPAHPNRAPGAGASGALDPETVQQLEELGYL